MKFRTIFQAEFVYQCRRITTRVYVAVLLLFTLLMNFITTPGDGIYPNATFYITGIIVLGGMIWLVMGASISGEAAARDVQVRMHPLTYTLPVSKFDHLGARFLAAFALNLLLVACLPLGVLLSFYLPGLSQAGLAPFRPWAYLSVFLLVSLPNVFIATAFQFSLATLTRKVMTSYTASLLLALFPQLIAVTAANLFGNWDLIKLLDPVGIAGVLSSELGTWTPTQKNTRLITLGGMFLWNRVLWIGLAAAALSLSYHRFKVDHPVPVRTRKKNIIEAEPAPAVAIFHALLIPHAPRFGAGTYVRQALAIAFASFARIARSPIGLPLVGAIALLSAVFGYRIMTQLGIPMLPTTQQVLSYLAPSIGNINTPFVVIPLLIMYFAGELVWTERETGLRDMFDAFPVPEWALLMGKWVGLGLLIFAFMSLLMAGGVLMQLLLGYHNIQPGLYLRVLFGIQFLPYLLFALLTLVVHVIVNQKHTGYVLMLVVYLFIAFPSSFGVEHPLLIFGATPGWTYSDMRGFGTTMAPWRWFTMYWVGWAILLAVAARLLWPRGTEGGFNRRKQLAVSYQLGATARLGILAGALIILTGGFIFYNTNNLNNYTTGAAIDEQQVAYERRYARFRETPQPQLSATRLQVEIYPDEQRADIQASYTLVNTHQVPVDTIQLGTASTVSFTPVRFNRPASAVIIDTVLGHHIYALRQPLQPGDSVVLTFEVHYRQRGFRHNNANALVLKNGSYFTNFDMLPVVGYQRFRELSDPERRRRFALPARRAIPSLDDEQARRKPALTDRNRFEAVIGTAMDEVAVAPGAMLGTWTAGNRRYVHFKTDAPIRGEYAVLSAHYSLKKTRWNGVTISMYYHPNHALNIDGMLGSIKASMQYYSEQFGPYPYRHFTVVERAGAGGELGSEASMVDYGEQFAIMKADTGADGFNLPYYILAHEVAHQWWGGASVTPANVEGAGVLIEGMAVFSGMQVLEKDYGDAHVRKFIGFLHSFYEMPRSLATAPLLRADEPFLYYRKSGLAMHALAKLVGKEKVNNALQQLLSKHHAGTLPVPTTLDLYAGLQQVTPDNLHYLLKDLFTTNTYWRLKSDRLTAKQADAGRWEATLEVQVQKVIVDSTGAEHEVPMNDWLEVGMYEEGKGLNKPLYLKMHRIRSGKQTITVTLPRKPGSGGIDPNLLMIDLRTDDNMVPLSTN